jgi:hypothetical protein
MPYDERPASLPLDVEECRTALWKQRGNVTKAAEMLKVPSSRLRAFIKTSPFLSAEVKEAQQQLLDISEDIAYDALMDDEDKGRQDTMARFIMTNLGGDRGYGAAKGGVTINAPKGTINISWADGTSFQPEESDAKVIEHE